MLKLLSLFSGIGAFEKALDNLEVPYELVAFCEFDKYAAKSYCSIHDTDESKNLGDITKVDETTLPKDIDILTYGFPCQDISLAGKQKGLFNEDGTQTRSGLFFEALRIIEETKPKIAIAENVKNLVGKKFNAQFQVVLASLESAGYNNYWKVLNAKDFGVPQNRERVFIVSIRKDLDTGKFEFPEGFPLEKRLKDVLEEYVDEKYYLSDPQMKSIIGWKAQQKPFERVLGNESISPTLTARGAGENHSGMVIYSPDNDDTCNMQEQVTSRFGVDKSSNNPSVIHVANCLTAREDRGVSSRKGEGTAICEIQQVGQIYPNSGNPQAGRVYDADGISPTMDTCSGGNRMPKVVVSEPQVLGGIGEKKSNGGSQWYQQDRIYDGDKVAISVATGFNPYYTVKEPTIQRVDIPQTVKVRKYPVNTTKLVEVLREQKQKCGWTNKDLAEELNLPITTVEHYFRTDDCFAIPEPQVWEDLKYLLEMDDIDEFDESIITFEEKEGVFEKAERHYFTEGIAPTLTSTSAGNEKIIAAYDEQNQYIRKDGCVGTIMTDGSSPKKNSRIVEAKIDVVGNYSPSGHDASRMVSADGLAPTVKENHGTVTATVHGLRIRKLTPKECFRLMGFDDESFHKAEAVNSNTQLYKQAGNSIVVDVLEELFCMMLDEDGNLYV